MTNRLILVSWNINSVRLRLDRVKSFIARVDPDIICLQEIKCRTEEFPSVEFASLGFVHQAVRGQKGWHGVAIVSKVPLSILADPPLCQHAHARSVAVRLEGGLDLHNLYVPAGGDDPDPVTNEKFAHKLDFLERMRCHYRERGSAPLLVVGDLNIAPHPMDVWSHRQLLGVVSHTPIETEALAGIIAAGGFCDIARAVTADDERLYSWWSYRARDWSKSDRGRRLDHIWANQAALPVLDMASYLIHKDERGGVKPSDHVPVCVEIKAGAALNQSANSC